MIFDLTWDLVLQEFHILSNKTWLKIGIIFSYSYSYYCYCYCYYCYCCCCYCCYCCCWCCLWFELIHPETILWRPEKEILQKSIHNLKIHIQTWITFSNTFWCILPYFDLISFTNSFITWSFLPFSLSLGRKSSCVDWFKIFFVVLFRKRYDICLKDIKTHCIIKNPILVF